MEIMGGKNLRVWSVAKGQTVLLEVMACVLAESEYIVVSSPGRIWAKAMQSVFAVSLITTQHSEVRAKIQLSVLIKFKAENIIISLKYNMFSLWYSWKITYFGVKLAHLPQKGNCRLTPMTISLLAEFYTLQTQDYRKTDIHLCVIYDMTHIHILNTTELWYIQCTYYVWKNRQALLFQIPVHQKLFLCYGDVSPTCLWVPGPFTLIHVRPITCSP